MKLLTIIIVIPLWLVIQNQSLAGANHDHHDDHAQEKLEEINTHGDAHNDHQLRDHKDELVARINVSLAEKVGIETASAGKQLLKKSIIVYGELTTAPEQLSHVRARYTGLVKSVSYSIGDSVEQSAILATVESNESLKTYSIEAPIDGMIIQRHANKGEVTKNQVLFSIANFDTLWAELKVFPQQQSLVAKGQIIFFHLNRLKVKGKVAHVIPVPDQPYKLARMKIDNSELALSPGAFIEASVIVDEFVAQLAVDNKALQTLDGKQGVFVQSDNNYQFIPLVLGREGVKYSEVQSGLLPGQVYVTKNSYLLKADIEKSAAEHAH